MRRSQLVVLGLGFSLTCSLAMGADKKGDPEKGKEVFQQCGVCHNSDSTEKKMGPGLKGLFQNEKMNNGKKPTEANVREMILKDGGKMTGFEEQLKGKDLDNLIAYLKTL